MRTLLLSLAVVALSGCVMGEAGPTGSSQAGTPSAGGGGGTGTGAGGGTGTGTVGGSTPAPVDDAQIVSVQFPSTLTCGDTATATVTVKNTGTSTWTKADGVKLGAVDDSDPLASAGRFELQDFEQIAPGATRQFAIPLTAPGTPGPAVSDWRMVRESVRWFGATTISTITLTPRPSSDKAMTRFAINGVDATITGTAVALALPPGTDVTHLTPTIGITGASVSPASGVQQSFASPVTYTVTAADGSTEAYAVTVSAPVIVPNGQDAIDLSTVQVFNSPQDVASWPITTTITNLTMTSPDVGLSFVFSALSTWPDYTPPGWDGPLQYTVWAVVNVNGQWYTSGFIQMWNGRPSTGAPIISDFAPNWAYDGRWGPMMGHQPVAGELMGFFVTAGNARGIPDVTSVKERSNVVMVALPQGDNGAFTF